MAMLRAFGPGFLAERFMAESPLQHCATISSSQPDPATDAWPGVNIAVSLAPWGDWHARIADALGFVSSAHVEIERLRSRYGALESWLDFPVTRRLGAETQDHEFPPRLLALLSALGLGLRMSYHSADFSGAAERHPRIFAHPEVCNGKPVIRGTRVLVRNLVDALAEGRTHSSIIEDFPDIAAEDIAAAVAFIREQAERA